MYTLKGTQNRIISKIFLNKLGQAQIKTNKIELERCELKINFIKDQKKISDVYEVLSLLEQFGMQKPLLKFEKLIEVGEKIKLKNVNFLIKLNQEDSTIFLWYFIHLLLADRKKRNLIESNYLNVSQQSFFFEYLNFKHFRKILLNEVININNYLKIEFKLKPQDKQPLFCKYKTYMIINYFLRK